MRISLVLRGTLIMLLMSFAFSCERPALSAAEVPAPKDKADNKAADTGVAVFAGGCFWCTEAVFEELDGVKEVVSGYAGGSKQTANYKQVSEGNTGHAEAIRITYDPAKVTFARLLQVFFATHDPTTKDRQGPDWGTQYRSAVFYANTAQKEAAEAYVRQLEESKKFSKPIVTTVEPLEAFYPAEEYHQNFVKHNPNHPYVLRWAFPKVDKVREGFKEQVKQQEQR